MKKYAVILFALLLVFSIPFVGCTSAQDDAGGGFVAIIESPFEGKIVTGNSSNLTFVVASAGKHTTALGDLFWVKSMHYNVSLDGEFYSQNQQDELSGWVNMTSIHAENLNLTNLTQGEHTIRVDIVLDYYISILLPDQFYHMSAAANFFVNRGIQPQVSILGFDAYKTNHTIFSITVNERGARVSYSLDNGANVTLPQNESMSLQGSYLYNVTLMGLPEGSHTLTAYVKDVFNQSAMAEKTFTVGQPLPFSTIAVAGGVATTVVVCIAAMLFFRKSKRKKHATLATALLVVLSTTSHKPKTYAEDKKQPSSLSAGR